MASQGPLSATAGASDSSNGSATAWNAPDEIEINDNTNANIFASVSANGISQYLKGTGFGFAIPGGSTIDGIVVEIAKYGSGTFSVADEVVSIVKGGTIGATNKKIAGNWPGTEAYATYGSSSDLWGESWSYSDINASNFGLAISIKETNGFDYLNAFVDHIRITVYYTEGGGGSTAKPFRRRSTRFFRQRF